MKDEKDGGKLVRKRKIYLFFNNCDGGFYIIFINFAGKIKSGIQKDED